MVRIILSKGVVIASQDGIIKSILAKFAPFMLKQTLVFDSLEQTIESRPVIIFHDTKNNYYYYIKARDAYSDGKKKKRFKGEILIKKSGEDKTLFTKDSYLDCLQIFYIHGSELEELIKKHPKTEILDSKELEFDQEKKYLRKFMNA